jgi:hypothetical protein
VHDHAHTTDTGPHRYSGSKGWGNLFRPRPPGTALKNLGPAAWGSNRPKPVIPVPLPDALSGSTGVDLGPHQAASYRAATGTPGSTRVIGRQISRISALPLEQQLAEWNKISALSHPPPCGHERHHPIQT